MRNDLTELVLRPKAGCDVTGIRGFAQVSLAIWKKWLYNE